MSLKEQNPSSLKGEQMEKQRAFKKLLSKYAERSSAVGPNHIRSSPHILGKVMWIIVFLAAIGATVYQTYDKICKYYEYNISVETQIVFNRELYFPAVTICNMNPYRKHVMAMKAPKLNGMMNTKTTGEMVTMPPITPVSNNGMNASATAMLQSMEIDTMQAGAWDQKRESQPEMAEDMAMVEDMLTEVNQMDDATRKMMGHMLETMLLRCSFNGAPCSPKDFHHFLNWRHGNCFTFNSGWGNITPVITRNAGSDYGLSMSFYLQTNEYVDALTETVGLKVILSDQNLIPFPEDEGTIISAGAHSQITIQRSWRFSESGRQRRRIVNQIMTTSPTFTILLLVDLTTKRKLAGELVCRRTSTTVVAVDMHLIPVRTFVSACQWIQLMQIARTYLYKTFDLGISNATVWLHAMK